MPHSATVDAEGRALRTRLLILIYGVVSLGVEYVVLKLDDSGNVTNCIRTVD